MSDFLYTPEGWLDFDYIYEQPAWLIVLIGKRQVGKTYGCLKQMLKRKRSFMLMRRTTTELKTIVSNPKFNPFKPFYPEYKVDMFHSGENTFSISEYSLDENGKAVQGEELGVATSLSQIAKVRGFDGSVFTDLVFDEFIPEKGVITKRSEGEDVLNALTTIGGNREILEENPRPPLRVWLLANTNNIDSYILNALNLTDDVLYARRKHKEELMLDDGTLIIQPDSTKIIEKRKETALMRRVSKNSEFYKMAIENEWAYDESPYIKTMPLKGMQPAWAYDDNIFAWKHPQGYYICRASFKGHNDCKYDGSRTDRERLAMEWSIMKPYYYAGCCTFSDLRALSVFKNIFDMS